MNALNIEKPTDKILDGICACFNVAYLYNGNFKDRDNIVLTAWDLDMNKDNSLFYFHIKPNNWDGTISHLVSWSVSLTKTGKVKARSLSKTLDR